MVTAIRSVRDAFGMHTPFVCNMSLTIREDTPKIGNRFGSAGSTTELSKRNKGLHGYANASVSFNQSDSSDIPVRCGGGGWSNSRFACLSRRLLLTILLRGDGARGNSKNVSLFPTASISSFPFHELGTVS